MSTMCCGKEMKVTDTRRGKRLGLSFKKRRRVCYYCDNRVSTFEVDECSFLKLLDIESIKDKLSDVGKLMRDL